MIRLYRALLHLYPTSFRVEYGEEMCAIFAARSGGSGPLAAVSLLLGAVADVVPNAVALHWTTLLEDLRHSARTLTRAPGFAFTAVLVTALGVGANAAAFSVADFVLFRRLPFPEPDALVKLWERPPGGGLNELSPADYRDLKTMSASFEAMGAFDRNTVNLVGAGEPQHLQAALVTPEVLPLLGVRPLLGRLFEEGDFRTVVLGHGLWQSRFAGDPGVLGRSVNLDGAPHEVIGVMPPHFRFPSREERLWVSLALEEEAFLDRDNTFLEGLARLEPGVTLDRARADLTAVAARLARDHPETNAETGAHLVRLRDELPERSRLLLLGLCGASLCTLLLACANLASLLLARAASRERELAVRAALGAGRRRLVRQMITESVTLALVGGVAGVMVAVAAVPLLARLVPSTLPLAGEPRVDLRVLALATLLTALTGLGFGLVPALRVGGRTGLSALRNSARAGGGRKRRLRFLLVTVEVAISVALLISSGLLVRAVWRIQATDPGFVTEGVLTVKTALPRPKYDHPVRRADFYDRVLTEVQALPGVQSAAYVTGLPMVMTGMIWPVVIPGHEVRLEAPAMASLRFVTPGFFRTLGIPLRRGRDVRESDTGDRPFVAVVSESLVRRHWPGEDPIGKRFHFGEQDRTVIGVVGDIRVRGLERASEPQVYLPHRQVPEGGLIAYDPKELVIRVSGESVPLLPAIRRIVRATDAEQPISDVRMLADVVAGETASRRVQLRVLGALAVIALLLAGVGIHGLLAYTVSQRSQEIGVRLTLGAEPAGVARMVLSDALRLSAIGIVSGIVIAYAAARGMGALLFGVAPGDPATISTAIGLSLLMTLAGALSPALRAMRVSPGSVMRAE